MAARCARDGTHLARLSEICAGQLWSAGEALGPSSNAMTIAPLSLTRHTCDSPFRGSSRVLLGLPIWRSGRAGRGRAVLANITAPTTGTAVVGKGHGDLDGRCWSVGRIGEPEEETMTAERYQMYVDGKWVDADDAATFEV